MTPPPVPFAEVPAVYVRWCRVDYPNASDGVVAEMWRWKTDAEHEFWNGIDDAEEAVRQLARARAIVFGSGQSQQLRIRRLVELLGQPVRAAGKTEG